MTRVTASDHKTSEGTKQYGYSISPLGVKARKFGRNWVNFTRTVGFKMSGGDHELIGTG